MFHAHSMLWHYLWVAPNVLLLLLAFVVWRRGISREIPAFLAFAVFAPLAQIATYFADVLPFVPAENFWRVLWFSLLIEALLKFALIGEVFSRVLVPFRALATAGKWFVRVVGVILVLVATLAAAYARPDSTFSLISGAHLLEQTVYFVESGLIVFVFIFAAYFRLAWDRLSLGILLGLGISACVHLGTWAILANGNLSVDRRTLLDMLNMATFHVCVLIWFFYLVFSSDQRPKTTVFRLPDHNLEALNDELERLLQR